MAQPSWHRISAMGACLVLQAPAALWANDITPTNGAQGFGTAVSNNIPGEYIITDGTVSGQNLLHGFDTFNIPAGGSATFHGEARPELIQSIFAVVSTGSSTLDGALNVNGFNPSTGVTPELFLMNANGFILGTGFSTNVQQLNLFAADGILLGCSAGSSGCGGTNQYQLLSVQTTGADLLANTSWSSSNKFKGLVSDDSLYKTILVQSDSLEVSELSLAGSLIHFDSDSNLSIKQLKIMSQWFSGAWTGDLGDLGDLVVGSFTPSNFVGSFGQFTPDPTLVEVDHLDTDDDMLPDPLSIYEFNGLGWTEPGDVVFAGAIRSATYSYQSPAAGSPLLNAQQAEVKVFARQAYISPVEFPGGTTSPFGPNAEVSSSEAISNNGRYFGFAATIDIDPALYDDYYIVDPYAYYSGEFDMWTDQDSDEGLDYNDYEAAYDDEDMALTEGDDGFDFGDGTDEAASDGSSDITTDDSADVTAAASLPSVDVPANEASANFISGEQAATSQAATALGLSAVEALSPQQAQQILQQAITAVQAQEGPGGQNRSSVWSEPATLLAATSPGSGTKGLLPQQFNRALYNPAILQLRFTEARGRTTNVDTDAFLDLTLIPASGAIVGRRVEVAIGSFSSQLKQLYSQLSRQEDLGVSRASAPARSLYEVLIGPLRDELVSQKVTTLLIGADRGLQGVPYAALHSGRDFLGERFAFALTPSLSLTNLMPAVAGEKRLLAAGASQFDGLAALPLVPQELKAIAASERSDIVLNASFTSATIERTGADPRYHRIHLATHAEFLPGEPSKSVLYSGTGPMSFATLTNLRKQRQDSPLDMIVLSACRTALGDRESEFGFAGLALQAGARSAIGTLWYVDDVATSAYFIQVYRYLEQGLPKAEALQFTRLDFASGRVQLSNDQIMAADGQVLLSGLTRVQQRRVNQGLANPYYWAGIELLGSPW